MKEEFKVISSEKCYTCSDLMGALQIAAESDPRDEYVGQQVAVHIDNKCVLLEVREFEDGTREFALIGV